MSEGGGDDQGRRYPRNWDGLLRFCVENTQTEDAPPGGQSLQQMSEERRQWLDEALASFAGTDPVKGMLEDIKLIMDPARNDETQEAALENLMMCCEDIDLARDFHKIGGFSLLTELLRDEREGFRWRGAELVAILVQNHPYCQNEALKDGMLPLLVNRLENDPSLLVRVKSLYGISCLTRACDEALTELIRQDGFSVLLRAMQSAEEKLQTKAAFLLTYIITEKPSSKDAVVAMGMVEQLIALLWQSHSNVHEHFMKALLDLVDGHSQAREDCLLPHLELGRLLRERQHFLAGKEECQEELDYSKRLYDICFGQEQQSTIER